MNYYYLGGAFKWSLADPSLSPIKPTDPPDWAFMVDMVHASNADGTAFAPSETAHREANGIPAGANHLFHDGHVAWIKWNHGQDMRQNAYWSWADRYYWRRSMAVP